MYERFRSTLNTFLMKTKKNKRILVISLITLTVLLVASVFLLPWLLRDKIIEKARLELNSKLDAEVNFSDVNISLFRNFPYATIRFENFYIAGKNEFVNDTLLFSKNIDLSINIKSLFSDTGYDIRKLEFNQSKVVVRVLDGGRANWKIMKKDSAQMADSSDMNFHWKLEAFSINNADIYYHYDKNGMDYIFKNVNHTTTGDLTADSSLLVTRTTCDSLSFIWDGNSYMKNAQISLNADINANLNDMIFKISKNSSKFNALPFSFSGWLQSIPEGWDMDFLLNTNEVDFKSLLSVIPAMYSTSFDELKTDGEVDIKGFVRGKWVNDFYPAFNLSVKASKAWFQYPSLPSRLENINVDARISNPGRTLDETLIDIPLFSFTLGGNPFKASLSVTNPVSDPDIKLHANGKLNTSYISKIFPLEPPTSIQGVVDLGLNIAGKKSWFTANMYDKFKFDGFMNMADLAIRTAFLPQKVEISKAALKFENRYAEVNNLQMKYGDNDMFIQGKFENYIGYLLYDSELKAVLSAKSKNLNVNDFMSENKEEKPSSKASEKETTALKTILIPENIDISMNASVENLKFADMTLTGSNTALKIKNKTLTIQDLNTSGFGGTMKLSGLYNSNDEVNPSMQLKVNLAEVAFKQIFNQVEVLRKYLPIFEKAMGKFSAGLSISALMGEGMSPVLQSINGDGMLSASSISVGKMIAVEAILKALKKNEIFPVNIDKIGMTFDLKDGKLITKPFSVKLWDTKLTLSGITGTDKTMDYNGKIQLPDKLKLGRFSTFNLSIGGLFSKPIVKVDLMNTVNEIVKENVQKAEDAIVEKVDEVKQAALEKARKEKEKAIAAARIQADKIINLAASQGEIMINQAKKQGDKLVDEAANPITKALARKAADGLVKEARKKADDLNQKAAKEAEKLIDNAASKTTF